MKEIKFEEKILERLGTIEKLLIWILADSSDRTLKDKIRMLSQVGFKPTQISNILNKPVNLISVMKHSIKFQEDKNDEENTKDKS